MTHRASTRDQVLLHKARCAAQQALFFLHHVEDVRAEAAYCRDSEKWLWQATEYACLAFDRVASLIRAKTSRCGQLWIEARARAASGMLPAVARRTTLRRAHGTLPFSAAGAGRETWQNAVARLRSLVAVCPARTLPLSARRGFVLCRRSSGWFTQRCGVPRCIPLALDYNLAVLLGGGDAP